MGVPRLWDASETTHLRKTAFNRARNGSENRCRKGRMFFLLAFLSLCHNDVVDVVGHELEWLMASKYYQSAIADKGEIYMTKLFNKLPPKVRKVFCITFIVLVIAVLISFFVCTFSVVRGVQKASDIVKLPEPERVALDRVTNSEMEFAQAEILETTYSVDFFDIGNADCTLLTNGDNVMLVDAGDAANSKYIAKKLAELSVTHFDFVVITNESEAHTGGLMAVLENYAVETLIVPDLDTKNCTLQSCFKVAKNKGVAIKQAQSLDAWNVGEAQVQILSAAENVIIRMTGQTQSFLLMSDASPEEEAALLELDMDITATVLKPSRRGSADTSSNAFLRMVEPEHVVISGKNDAADVYTVSRLIEYAGGVFVTDSCGTITFLTNGKDLKVETTRNDCDLSIPAHDNVFYVP